MTEAEKDRIVELCTIIKASLRSERISMEALAAYINSLNEIKRLAQKCKAPQMRKARTRKPSPGKLPPNPQ